MYPQHSDSIANHTRFDVTVLPGTQVMVGRVVLRNHGSIVFTSLSKAGPDLSLVGQQRAQPAAELWLSHDKSVGLYSWSWVQPYQLSLWPPRSSGLISVSGIDYQQGIMVGRS